MTGSPEENRVFLEGFFVSSDKKIEFKNRLPIFDSGSLEAIARILGDTGNGFTGADIQRHLSDCCIADVDPSSTKWKRLYNALVTFQNEHQVGNHVIILINKTMQPSLHLSNAERFNWFLDNLNEALSFSGYRIDQDGKVKETTKANTLEDAKTRASTLKKKLEQRNAHTEVFRFCDEQLLQNNYFHATLEAVKSITSRIRTISKLSGDGAELIENAFSSIKGVEPVVKINAYDSETKIGEQRGFVNLLKGLYGTFRNPLGHEAKIEWEISEEDALDIMSLVSLVHRKLDKA